MQVKQSYPVSNGITKCLRSFKKFLMRRGRIPFHIKWASRQLFPPVVLDTAGFQSRQLGRSTEGNGNVWSVNVAFSVISQCMVDKIFVNAAKWCNALKIAHF